MIEYKKKGDKYVFSKDGIYFALTVEQMREMEGLFVGILEPHHCVHGMPLEWPCNACADKYGASTRAVLTKNHEATITIAQPEMA